MVHIHTKAILVLYYSLNDKICSKSLVQGPKNPFLFLSCTTEQFIVMSSTNIIETQFTVKLDKYLNTKN